MRRMAQVVLAALLLTASVTAQTSAPGAPSGIGVIFSNEVACTDPIPQARYITWLHWSGIEGDPQVATVPGPWTDAEPYVSGDSDYCEAIGMGTQITKGLGGIAEGYRMYLCPVRPPCPGFKCEEKRACQQAFIQAPAPIWSLMDHYFWPDGPPLVPPPTGTVIVNPANPWQARCVDCVWALPDWPQPARMQICDGPKLHCGDP